MDKNNNDSFINKTMDKFVSLYGFIFRTISDIVAVILGTILFVFYQIFVQLLWLGIAIKFVNFILSFKLLKKLDIFLSQKLQKTTRWESFFIFIIPMIPMEYFALMATSTFINGNISLGILLYSLKFVCAIPVSYIYKHTKEELLSLGTYGSFNTNYTDEEFYIAHKGEHTRFTLDAKNIPLGWISLPKFIINILIFITKNSRVFKNISSWFKKIKHYLKQNYIKTKEFIKKPKISKEDISFKIKKIFNNLKSKFNKS